MKLQHGSFTMRPLIFPAVAGGSTSDMLDQEVGEEEAGRFKSAVGALMYTSPERPDAQYAIRELTKFLKKPTVGSMHALSHVVRYLKDSQLWDQV